MKKKYRNELFQLINKAGFNQDDFSLTEDNIQGLPAVILQYKKTPFRFIIRNSRESFEDFDYKFVSFGPGYSMTDIQPQSSYANFDTVYANVERWLNLDVKEYIEDESEPDLWTEFKRGNKTINIDRIDFNDKGNFSYDEKRQISMAVNELKLLIHNGIQTNQEEQKLVNERLDYLIEASGRLNKFDWKSLAISTLISISIALSLDTQKGQMLFDLFKKVFSVIPLLT
jgi:hypothetical protein